jgi:hypothetical protein
MVYNPIYDQHNVCLVNINTMEVGIAKFFPGTMETQGSDKYVRSELNSRVNG